MSKGQPGIPTLLDLESAYHSLLHQAKTNLPIKDLVTFIGYSRFDPRLAEILVSFFSKVWARLNPIDFRNELNQRSLGAICAVLLEFTPKQLGQSGERDLFLCWKNLVVHGLEKRRGELFFIGIWKIGGSLMQQEAFFPTAEYERWGFLGRANLCPKTTSLDFSVTVRKQILENLFRSGQAISSVDYWNAIGRCISLRQAERDLQRLPNVRSMGRTRNKRYQKK